MWTSWKVATNEAPVRRAAMLPLHAGTGACAWTKSIRAVGSRGPSGHRCATPRASLRGRAAGEGAWPRPPRARARACRRPTSPPNASLSPAGTGHVDSVSPNLVGLQVLKHLQDRGAPPRRPRSREACASGRPAAKLAGGKALARGNRSASFRPCWLRSDLAVKLTKPREHANVAGHLNLAERPPLAFAGVRAGHRRWCSSPGSART